MWNLFIFIPFTLLNPPPPPYFYAIYIIKPAPPPPPNGSLAFYTIAGLYIFENMGGGGQNIYPCKIDLQCSLTNRTAIHPLFYYSFPCLYFYLISIKILYPISLKEGIIGMAIHSILMELYT